MAASMVSAVVPATVGAADASKGFAIKTYDISKPAASDAKSSITINKKDIPADGYVIPSAVYYSEGANATDSLLVAITTDSKDISFKLYNPTKEGYTSEEKEYTLGGESFSTSSYISFAGSYDDLDGYSAAGKYVFGIDESQSAAGTDNYFIGCSWTNNGKDYKWAGEKSDSYPFYVFDTVIPQNIAAGEYTIKFCEYNTDASGVNDNPSPLVEGEKTRFTTKGGNLKLETMKIVVAGDEEVTTKAPDVTTTTTTPKVTDAPKETTTTKPVEVVQDGDIQFTFADKDGNTNITAAAGDEITIYANVKAGGKAVSAMDVQFKATNGLEITTIGGKSTALDGSAVSTNIDEARANFTSTDDAGEPIVPADGKAAFTLKVKVPADAKDSTYTIGFADQCKVFKDSTNFNYKTSFAPLTIVVGETVVTDTTTKETTTTTTTSTTTTSKPVSTTTTTTTTAPKTNDGKKVWGDANEDGDVNVCDVVLVLTYISDSSIDYFTEQGKINADVAGSEGITSEDSETLIKYCLKQISKPE